MYILLMQKAINIFMLLSELYDEELVEGPLADRLKRLAAAGAVAGGLGLGGYSTLNMPKTPEAPLNVAQTQQEPQIDVKKQPEPQKAEKKINPNFPKELTDVDKMTVDQRVAAFSQTVLPLIQAENAKILGDRSRLIRDIKYIKSGKKLPQEENMWVYNLTKKYHEDNLYDLLEKIDIIPPSIALAQAAIESTWGQDEKTRSSNAFYGQKSWAKSGGVEGPYGERYRAFETPRESIAAYMTNLNTNDAYDDFRTARAAIRKSGKPITGLPLVPKLINYTDTGKAYPQKLASMIKGRDLQKYDIVKK
jgi:hypothetical protein